jgi:hypothetical protein
LNSASPIRSVITMAKGVKPLNKGRARLSEIKTTAPGYSRFYWFQENLARGNQQLALPCGRSIPLYLRGRPRHYCSQQRGYPGVPLATYTFADIEREYFAKKPCAPHCTVGCVQKISVIDHWRDPQVEPSSMSVGLHIGS